MRSDPESLLGGEESAWIVAARGGDRQAFARVVELYWEPLYRWLFHLTRDQHQAEDLTQETFLKALAGLESFRCGSNFRAWLFRIGHNNFVNLKRSRSRGYQTLPDALSRSGASVAEQAADREEIARLVAAIAELPTEYRAALLLRAEGGLSFREIATILDITEETARWRVFKARQKLLTRLGVELVPAKAEPEPERLT